MPSLRSVFAMKSTMIKGIIVLGLSLTAALLLVGSGFAARAAENSRKVATLPSASQCCDNPRVVLPERRSNLAPQPSQAPPSSESAVAGPVIEPSSASQQSSPDETTVEPEAGHASHKSIVPRRPIKAVYISFFGISDSSIKDHVFTLLENTELNALVIDVKGDKGGVVYYSDIPIVKEIAQKRIPLPEVEDLMVYFGERGIYPIARIVVFKDNPMAMAYPELAVRDSRGGPWIDSEDLAWTDPFNERVWDYNIAIAKEAAMKGFMEVQFDYIRFPTDGAISRAVYSKPNTEENRVAAITGFLAKAKQELAPLGVKVGVDTFGYTAWRSDDMGIGQHLESIAPYVDVVSPMLYPSTFADGIPGYVHAVSHPYEIVHQSTQKAVDRLSETGVEVRPWIQAFNDYAFDNREYTDVEIKAQKRGVYDAGATGWMLWNPKIQYPPLAFEPPSPDDTLPPWSPIPLIYHEESCGLDVDD